MNKNSSNRTVVVGAGEVSEVRLSNLSTENIHRTNSNFWDAKGNDVIGATALPKYGAFISEDKHNLFGDVEGKKLLEICCGTGQSLKYHGDKKALELWGIDISEKQIELASNLLASQYSDVNLICSPMEAECGLPVGYFDYVYSVYGIGWTTDLVGTFKRIASYLKKDGVFIFSWSHPIHKCVVAEDDRFEFKKSYYDESWYSISLGGDELTLSDRKLSTYVNALAKTGFLIEEMIEESDEELLEIADDNNQFAKKAAKLPVTFVIKARKI